MAFTRHLWGTGGGFADLFHSEAVGTRVLQSHPLARLFKIAISRAVKEPDVDEKKRALETLAKRGIASPTYTELLKEVGIFHYPSPKIQEERIKKVINTFKVMDMEQVKLATMNEEATSLILFIYNPKNTNNVDKVLERQLTHVRCGCITNMSNCKMHQFSPNGDVNVLAQSSKNEGAHQVFRRRSEI